MYIMNKCLCYPLLTKIVVIGSGSLDIFNHIWGVAGSNSLRFSDLEDGQSSEEKPYKKYST